jgi:formiminotetrahydrofolate cyclodeaminase
VAGNRNQRIKGEESMLSDSTVVEFLKETAGDSPVPGGGSMAAHSGASAAALTEMVANLTLGKKSYEAVSAEMGTIAAQAAVLREQLVLDIDRDAEAYAGVMTAYQLPKETEAEKMLRGVEIQRAMRMAAIVPLEVARRSGDVMDLAIKAVARGNRNAITDGAVAGMLARTAVLAAVYNVKINLDSIKDTTFVETTRQELDRIKAAILAKEQELFKLMDNEGL